jgi:hypothetical protein
MMSAREYSLRHHRAPNTYIERQKYIYGIWRTMTPRYTSNGDVLRPRPCVRLHTYAASGAYEADRSMELSRRVATPFRAMLAEIVHGVHE